MPPKKDTKLNRNKVYVPKSVKKIGSSIADMFNTTTKNSFTVKAIKQVGKEFGPGTIPYKAVGASAKAGVSAAKSTAKASAGLVKFGANIYRKTPRPVKVGGMLLGGAAMLGVSMIKGALNQSREIVYERYMQDAAVGRNMLNNTRIGLASGTSRMQNYGSTMGLSNAMSKTRHGGM